MATQDTSVSEETRLRNLIEAAFSTAYRCALCNDALSLHKAWRQFKEEHGLSGEQATPSSG